MAEDQGSILVGLGSADQQQFPAIRRGDSDVDHLKCRHLLQDCPRSESPGNPLELLAQAHREAVGQEGHKEVGLDPIGSLVVDRPQAQIALRVRNASSTWLSCI